MNRTWKFISIIGLLVGVALIIHVTARIEWVYTDDNGLGAVNWHSSRSFWSYTPSLPGFMWTHFMGFLTIVMALVILVPGIELAAQIVSYALEGITMSDAERSRHAAFQSMVAAEAYGNPWHGNPSHYEDMDEWDGAC